MKRKRESAVKDDQIEAFWVRIPKDIGMQILGCLTSKQLIELRILCKSFSELILRLPCWSQRINKHCKIVWALLEKNPELIKRFRKSLDTKITIDSDSQAQFLLFFKNLTRIDSSIRLQPELVQRHAETLNSL